MPTNEERREAAKLKLEQELSDGRRAKQRRIFTASVRRSLLWRSAPWSCGSCSVARRRRPTTPLHPPLQAGLPQRSPVGRRPAAGVQGACRTRRELPVPSEPAESQQAGRGSQIRQGAHRPGDDQRQHGHRPGQHRAGLNNAEAPCTVNSFASLAQKGFFDDTVCHRLTTTPGLGVLQCGDPTGSGSGGPGYQFANEYPTNQYPKDDLALQSRCSTRAALWRWPTRAPTPTAASSSGLQGLNCRRTTPCSGTIDPTGLATLDKIAEKGAADGAQDGKPATEVKVKSVLLD